MFLLTRLPHGQLRCIKIMYCVLREDEYYHFNTPSHYMSQSHVLIRQWNLLSKNPICRYQCQSTILLSSWHIVLENLDNWRWIFIYHQIRESMKKSEFYSRYYFICKRMNTISFSVYVLWRTTSLRLEYPDVDQLPSDLEQYQEIQPWILDSHLY